MYVHSVPAGRIPIGTLERIMSVASSDDAIEIAQVQGDITKKASSFADFAIVGPTSAQQTRTEHPTAKACTFSTMVGSGGR